MSPDQQKELFDEAMKLLERAYELLVQARRNHEVEEAKRRATFREDASR
jgi:hypothetical protein